MDQAELYKIKRENKDLHEEIRVVRNLMQNYKSLVLQMQTKLKMERKDHEKIVTLSSYDYSIDFDWMPSQE